MARCERKHVNRFGFLSFHLENLVGKTEITNKSEIKHKESEVDKKRPEQIPPRRGRFQFFRSTASHSQGNSFIIPLGNTYRSEKYPYVQIGMKSRAWTYVFDASSLSRSL